MADDNEEDVCDSWEDMVDNEILEKKLHKIKPHMDEESDYLCYKGNFVGPVIVEEDTVRTQYVPPEPQVKILKRPSTANKQEGVLLLNGEKLSKQPVKSLQQREAEYAEARLRILGAAKSDEEIAEERLSKMGIAHPTEIAMRTVQIVQPSEAVSIIRQPFGPDGTSGFTLKR